MTLCYCSVITASKSCTASWILMSEKHNDSRTDVDFVVVHVTIRSYVWIFSGGTKVTVSGRHLNSVAEPRITLTVVITRFDDDFNEISSETRTSSQVLTV